MKTDDQWFQPGQKVLRAVAADPTQPEEAHFYSDMVPFGVVFCVDRCFECPGGYNVLWFTGLPIPYEDHDSGWVAANFRAVEEVRLCVEAAQHVKKPERTKVEA